MATTGVFPYVAGYSPVPRRILTSCRGTIKQNRNRPLAASTFREHAISSTVADLTASISALHEEDTETLKKEKEVEKTVNVYANPDEFPEEEEEEEGRKTLTDFLHSCKELIESDDSGPPRWFSPLDCGSRKPDSPLLLFLPGIDGTGLGLLRQHQKLGKIFDIWCLHIPVKDRTSFAGLIELVENAIQREYSRLPNRPIYLVGESIGGCLALAVASRNPDADLVLILANPATSFGKSILQPLIPLLQGIPDGFFVMARDLMLRLITGDHLKMMMENVAKGVTLALAQTVVEKLSPELVALSSYLSVLIKTFSKDTLQWKLQMLNASSTYANSRLHGVKAEVLLLCSGVDQLFPSQEEGYRLRLILPNSVIRNFSGSQHFLFLENGIDLVTIIKGASIYRRGKNHDCGTDYLPPTPSEVKQIYNSSRWVNAALSAVMLSTTDDGKLVKGLAGIPSEGPVLYVGYHMFLGVEVVPLVSEFLTQKNILIRALAHPVLFRRLRDGYLPDVSTFDPLRMLGAVPVSATNFYNLLSSDSHILLFPGGVREALHRKGEEYKLFWPERAEFVRMAARFGAKIVPFGVVGVDDFVEMVFDYNDQQKIPYLKEFNEKLTAEAEILRDVGDGDVGDQHLYPPWLAPRIPGRYYYYFGKPIETKGRKQEFRDKEKCHELYMHIKSEVERYMDYLKQKREEDPYRNIVTRVMYQSKSGFKSEVPSFDL